MSGSAFNGKSIAIESGGGSYLYSDDSTEYLGPSANYAVAALGHSHPVTTSAIQEQAAKLIYAQASYPVEAHTELYEKLVTFAPDDISNVWLYNSGTEVNEAAVKFAHPAAGRQKIVATKRVFRGHTLGGPALTWEQKYKKPCEPIAGGVGFVSYSGKAGLTETVDDETAAVFLELIQGKGGINPAAAEHLQATRDLIDDTGAVLIFDGIQIGIGRTRAL